MADIAPLTPLRYNPVKLTRGLGAVVSPPYDVIGVEERKTLCNRDPYNVVRLILPEGEGDARYANAAADLAAWQRDGVLVRDDVPAFYRYDQTFTPIGRGGQSIRRRGFLALVRTVPFSERIVLPHERTLSGPKEDRLRLFRATRTQLSPGFMLYRDPKKALDSALERATLVDEFSTEDGVQHTLSKVTERDAIHAIVHGIAQSSLLIADGHHRYETAVRYADEVDAASPHAPPDKMKLRASRHFMAFLANGDDPDLVVFPTHRLVHSLDNFSFDAMLERAKELFSVTALPKGPDMDTLTKALADAGKHGASFVAIGPGGDAVLLTLRRDVDLRAHPILGRKPEVVRRTDACILHDGLIEGNLGVTPAAQVAHTHLRYYQDPADAWARLGSGGGNVVFLMNATPVAAVRDVAEAGEVMPQKSTFFYPKVLTGLVLHSLDGDRDIALMT